MNTGQISPISTEFEMPLIDSAAVSAVPALVHSAASSSAADSWSSAYPETAQPEDTECGMDWENQADDAVTVPKLEPAEDDDFRLGDVAEAPGAPASHARAAPPPPLKLKRPRGRPRKHPLTPLVAASKVAKGRSKTGCITCRKRKKKCDEAKPRCMNCEKNAVVCEGYHEKILWKSGRERAEEERQRSSSLPQITLQPIFQGVETPEDMVFLNHYISHLSGVLTVEGQHKNAFKDMLLPMAVEHRGLMHSILSLAGKHFDCEAPYGIKVLQSNAKISVASLRARSQHHHNAAMARLCEPLDGDEQRAAAADADSDSDYSSGHHHHHHHHHHHRGVSVNVNLSPRYGQMLCLLLQTLAEGSANGEHRVHLRAYQNLMAQSPPPPPGTTDRALLVFITELFQYRVFADELIRHPPPSSSLAPAPTTKTTPTPTPRLAAEDWTPCVPIEPPRLIGVADGLLRHLAAITTIRDAVRANLAAGADPVVDYAGLYRAAEIDAALREWQPCWPPGDGRHRVGLLYKQMLWVYLFRTIYPPSSSPGSGGGGCGSGYSSSSPPSPPSSPLRRPPLAEPPVSPPSPPPSERPTSSHHATTPPPPPPNNSQQQQQQHHDARVTVAVDEALALLGGVGAGDATQALLLAPCLVIGAACFRPEQRARAREALRAARGYTGLRCADRVAEVLAEVWRLMDAGEWARAWDWQGVARDLGLDFSCA
ncbi:fungal-specific transcription factor domain-containing protein [Xylariaceae sp. FL0804]|nr:fungal-specific transcription factor domain-containing protein [Xylariaceae sp. FL0804]